MYDILSLHSYSILNPEMTAEIGIEFLQGNNEQVIKEAAIRADGVARLHYLFRPPYHMEPHGSKESVLNWDDGFIHYSRSKQY